MVRKAANLGLRFVAKDHFNAVHDVWGKLWDDLERLEVVEHLLGPARAEDDRRCVLERAEPREREVLHLAVELCAA